MVCFVIAFGMSAERDTAKRRSQLQFFYHKIKSHGVSTLANPFCLIDDVSVAHLTGCPRFLRYVKPAPDGGEVWTDIQGSALQTAQEQVYAVSATITLAEPEGAA